jgi:ABC-type transport system involved in multi-copper enzyme maturation permease subunit
MKWLFWKEYRQNRPIVIAMLIFLIVPYLFGIHGFWRCRLAYGNWDYSFLYAAAIFSLAILQLVIALIGGNVIAGERVDRSAEFQAYLPFTRKQIFTAKALLALAIAAVIWLPNLIAIASIWNFAADSNQRMDVLQQLVNIASTGLAMLGVAWLCSAVIKSPTISTFAGLITPLIIWSIIYYVAYLIEDINHVVKWPDNIWDNMEYTYRGMCLAIGPICFGIGAWLFLRRVEP